MLQPQNALRPSAAQDADINWDEQPEAKQRLLDLNEQKGKLMSATDALEKKYSDPGHGDLHERLRADADSYEALGEEIEQIDETMEGVMEEAGADYRVRDWLPNY